MSQTEDSQRSAAGADRAGRPASMPLDRCTHCRRPFETGEASLVLMRDGSPVAAYHERCHPHYRRSGCSAC